MTANVRGRKFSNVTDFTYSHDNILSVKQFLVVSIELIDNFLIIQAYDSSQQTEAFYS